jgi:membrane associated rhomboid family serine protease
MIPIRDENPTRLTPYVTVLLIAANCLVFIYEMMLPPEQIEGFVRQFGAVPALVMSPVPLDWVTLITSMFLHGGLLHLLGNMLYLWIFGNNIEDRLGHLGFIGFYLLGGIAAALTHILLQPDSMIPMVGASGAISAVLGAYMIVFPRARVVLLVWLFLFVRTIRVPAFLVLGLWFVMQISGVMQQSNEGIAWYAHVGGFAAGIVLILASGKLRNKQPR